MLIDLHTYFWESPRQPGPAMAQRLDRLFPEPWKRPDPSIEAFDRAMNDVTYAVILGFESVAVGAAITAQHVAACVKRRPGKYLGFASVDPLNTRVSDAIDEIVDLGLSGVVISPAAMQFHPAHTRAMELYELCEARKLPVLVLPGISLTPTAKLEFAQPWLFDEIAGSFPTLRLVVAELGQPWIDQTMALIEKHANVYADLADLVRQPWRLFNALAGALEMRVMDKLLLGSGYPFCTPRDAIATLYSINNVGQGSGRPTIPRPLLRAIVERDTLSCLGIAQPTVADEPPVRSEERTEVFPSKPATPSAPDNAVKENVG